MKQLQKLSELIQEGPRPGCYPNDIGKTLQDELEQSGATKLNYDYKTDNKWIENEQGNQEFQATHLLEGRGNSISLTEEQVCQLLNPNGTSGSFLGFDSDGGVIFEYQSCSSLQEPGFWG